MFHIFLDLQNLISLSMILGWNLLFQMTYHKITTAYFSYILTIVN